jgi:hypothetical protein
VVSLHWPQAPYDCLTEHSSQLLVPETKLKQQNTAGTKKERS